MFYKVNNTQVLLAPELARYKKLQIFVIISLHMLSTEREYRLGILSITVVSFQLQVFIFFLTPRITPFHQDAKEKDVDEDNPPNSKMFDSTRERNTDDVALLAKRRL